jgi:hypothetical protein
MSPLTHDPQYKLRCYEDCFEKCYERELPIARSAPENFYYGNTIAWILFFIAFVCSCSRRLFNRYESGSILQLYFVFKGTLLSIEKLSYASKLCFELLRVFSTYSTSDYTKLSDFINRFSSYSLYNKAQISLGIFDS